MRPEKTFSDRLQAFRQRWTPRRVLLLALSLIPSALLLSFRPLGMSFRQAAVAAALVLTVIWWVSKLVDRTVASVFLLLAFCLVGNTPLRTVFSFPLSETFVLIVFSFLFSEGVKNSGLLDKLLLPLLCRWATGVGRVLLSFLLVNLVMIFVIPQPFSRIILAAMIYDRFLRRAGVEERPRQLLMFSLHMTAIFVNMCFLRGDLILNNAMLSISGAPYAEADWMRAMALPALVLAAAGLVVFRLAFHRELGKFPPIPPVEKSSWSNTEKRNLVFLLAVILFWATEDLHGVSGTITVCAGTLLMVPLKLLGVKDLRCVDVKLLVFLTAAFSIGGVMKASGTANVIFSQFTALFPAVFSGWYLLIVVAVCMVMHLVLGSSITTMSVVIPSLMVISADVAPLPMLLFSIYIVSSGHCLLPFHNVITMIGEGRGYFLSRDMTRYGAVMTAPILLMVLFVFYGWWRLIGLG